MSSTLDKIVEKYCELPKPVRRPLWQLWHKLIIRFDKSKTAVFLNYGYEPLNNVNPLVLKPEDEENRYCIQLYDHVVNKVDLKGKEVLEVGCGRGGGASYITRYFNPSKYIGLDIAKSVIDFNNRYYNVQGLSFVKGFAEDLPYSEAMFDAVVNVESARCYANIAKFFAEVYKVLRPGGYFLFADMIKQEEFSEIESLLNASGLKLISKTNITDNVVKALDIDVERREKLIDNNSPKFLRGAFAEFAGVKGTERYDSFASHRMEYWSFVLQK